MGRLIDCNDVYNAIQITTDNFGVAKSVVENNMLTMLSKIETVEAIPKDQINKAIEKIEEYICDVETDTVKAQGMAQALDMLEQELEGLENGTNEKTSD